MIGTFSHGEHFLGAFVIGDGGWFAEYHALFPQCDNLQHRGGKGLKVHQLTEKTGQLTGVLMVGENDELMLITSEGVIIRLRGREISSYNRDSQGVKLMNLDDGVSVVGIAKISEEDIEEEAEETAAEAEKTEVE